MPWLNRTSGNFEGKRSGEAYRLIYEMVEDYLERIFGEKITEDNAGKVVKTYNSNPTIFWTVDRSPIVPNDDTPA